MSYAQYQVAVAPPWLQDQWGSAWLSGHGATKDDYLAQFVAGVKAAFPELAPADALAALGDEIGLDQGPNETMSAYATRLRQAWVYWPYAGTPVGLLVALHFAGLTGAVIVQQNGRAYQLTEPYTPGADPTANLVVGDTNLLAVNLTSSVTPPTASSAGRSIPSGNVWWEFDSNTDFCSRFAVIVPSWPFSALTTATFSGTDSVAVTWPFQFASTTYLIQVGTPTVIDGGGVVLNADGTTQTTSGVTIRATAPFSGYASVIAYAAGVNPLNVFSTASVGALKSTILKWKPAKTTCLGVYAITGGKCFGWPIQAQSANTMGAAAITQILGAF